MIPEWKPQFVKDYQRIFRSRRFDFEPREISLLRCSNFLLQQLGTCATETAFNPRIISKKLLQSSPTETLEDAFDKVMKTIESQCGTSVSGEIRRITGLLCTRARTPGDEEGSVEIPESFRMSRELSHCEAAPARRKDGTFDLPERKRLKTLNTGGEKLDLLLKIKGILDSKAEGEKMKEVLRVFVFKTLNPVLGCFNFHFGSNREEFLKTWGCFKHSEFRKNCCSGLEAEECGKQ